MRQIENLVTALGKQVKDIKTFNMLAYLQMLITQKNHSPITPRSDHLFPQFDNYDTQSDSSNMINYMPPIEFLLASENLKTTDEEKLSIIKEVLLKSANQLFPEKKLKVKQKKQRKISYVSSVYDQQIKENIRCGYWYIQSPRYEKDPGKIHQTGRIFYGPYQIKLLYK